MNTERYGVSLRIQPECGKMRARVTRDTDTLRFHPYMSSLLCIGFSHFIFSLYLSTIDDIY